MPKYKVNGRTFNIPDNEVDLFEGDFPEAQLHYQTNDGRKFTIYANERKDFLSDFPDATELGWSETIKEQAKQADPFQPEDNLVQPLFGSMSYQDNIGKPEDSLYYPSPLSEEGRADYEPISAEERSKQEYDMLMRQLNDFDAQNGNFMDTYEAYEKAAKHQVNEGGFALDTMEREYVNANSNDYHLRKQERDALNERIRNNSYFNKMRMEEADAANETVDAISNLMAQNEAENTELHKKMKAMNALAMNPRGSFSGFSKTKEMQDYVDERDDLLTAKRLYENTAQVYAAPINDGEDVLKKFGQGFAQRGDDLDFWTMGIVGIADDMNARAAFQKIQDKFGSVKEFANLTDAEIDALLTPSEQLLISAVMDNNAALYARKDNTAGAYEAGAGAADSLMFMAQFLLTGGIGDAATVGTAAHKRLVNWLGRKVGSMSNGLMKDVARGAVKLGVGTAESIGKALVMTPLMPHTYANIADKIMSFDDNGELMDVTDAILTGAADALIETWSESTGDFVNKILGVPGGITKGIAKKALKNVDFSDWGKVMNAPMMKILKKGGFNGFLGEMGEEFIGNAVRSISGLEPDAFKEFTKLENLLVTAGSFAPMTIFGLGTSSAQYGLAKRKLNNAQKAFESMLRDASHTEDQVKYIVDELLGSTDAHLTPERLVANFSPLLRELAFNDRYANNRTQTMQAAVDFMWQIARYRTFDGVYHRQEEQQRNDMLAEIQEGTGREFWTTRLSENAGLDGTAYETDEVRAVEFNDGRVAYVLGGDGVNNTVVYNDGQTGFLSEEQLNEGKANGSIVSDATMSLNDYLTQQVARVRMTEEEQRMFTERNSNIGQLRAQFPQDATVELGTTEAPIQGVVRQQTPDGVLVESPAGISQLTWEELGRTIGVEVNPQTDAQMEEEAINNLEIADLQRRREREQRRAQRNTAAEAALEAEQMVDEAENEGLEKPIPMKADGTVDQTAFWNESPARWAQWKTEQRQDGGAYASTYIQNAIGILEGQIAESEAAFLAESDFDAKDALEQTINQQKARLAELQDLAMQYIPSVIPAETSAEATAEQTQPGAETSQPAAVMADRQKFELDAEYQRRLSLARALAEKEMILKEYFEAISAGSMEAVVMNKQNYKQIMKENGCSEDDILEVENTIKRAEENNESVDALHVNDHIFILADYVTSVEKGRVSYVHERQHNITKHNPSLIQRVLSLGLSREQLQKIVRTLAGTDYYDKKSDDVLADEILSSTMEIAYTFDDFSVTLSKLGLPIELINVLNEINDEQRNDYSLVNARRSQNANNNAQRSGRQNDGNQGEVSGGVLGQEREGTLDNSPRGNQGAGESGEPATGGAEASEEGLQVPVAEVEEDSEEEPKGPDFRVTGGEPENIEDITEPDGTVRFSVRTYHDWTDNLGHQHKGTRAMVIEKMKEMKFSKKDIKKMIAKMDAAYEYMEKLRTLTDDQGRVRFEEFNEWAKATPLYKQVGRDYVKAITSLVSNGDYPINLELTTDCIKREAFTHLLNALVKRGAQLSGMGPAQIITMQKVMKQYGIEVACQLCFVEGKRLQIVNWASQIVEDWNDALEQAGVETDEYFEFGKDGDAFIPSEEWRTYEDKPKLLKALRAIDDAALLFQGIDPETFKAQREANQEAVAQYIKEKSEAWSKKNNKPASEWKPNDTQKAEIKKLTHQGLAPSYVNENLSEYRDAFNRMRNEWLEKNPNADPLSFTPTKKQWDALDKIRNRQIDNVKAKMVRLIMEHPEMRKKMTINDLLGSKGLMEIRQQHGQPYADLYSIILQRFGTGTPKPVQDAVPYDGEVMTLTESAFKKANEIGGARLFSFSDFDITKVFDYMQMFFDLEAKRQKLQSYTKEVAAVLIFGRSNAKFNISTLANALVPAEVQEEYKKASEKRQKELRHQWAENAGLIVDENGTIVGINFSEEHSVSPEFAQSIFRDDTRNKDCGAIMVGASVNHAIYSAAINWIRMVIPFHLSGMPLAAREKTDVLWYTDNTEYQSTRRKTKDGWSKIEASKDTFNLYEGMDQPGWDMRQRAKDYLAWCAENGYRPKFDWGINSDYYRAYCEEAGYTPNQQIIDIMDADTTDGVWNQYYKFLTDFTAYKPVFNEQGEMINEISSPQLAVESNFDFSEMEKDVLFEGEKSMLSHREENIKRTENYIEEIADRVVPFLNGEISEEEMNLREDVHYENRADAELYLNAQKKSEGPIDLVEEARKADLRHRMSSENTLVPGHKKGQPMLSDAEMMAEAVSFRITKNTRATIESWCDKAGLDEDIKIGFVDHLEFTFDDATEQLCAAKWYLSGKINLPNEDEYKVRDAVKVAKRNKVDALSYESPMDILNTFGQPKEKVKPINPDNVPTLKNRTEVPGTDIVIYDVEESEESRENMREIINTHYGKNASPWCLLQGNEDGKLTKLSAEYWQRYSAYPKKVAFKGGRLLAFSANSSKEITWWDRQDHPYNNIPITQSLNDEKKRKQTVEINPKTGKEVRRSNIFSVANEDGYTIRRNWNKIDGPMVSAQKIKDGQVKALFNRYTKDDFATAAQYLLFGRPKGLDQVYTEEKSYAFGYNGALEFYNTLGYKVSYTKEAINPWSIITKDSVIKEYTFNKRGKLVSFFDGSKTIKDRKSLAEVEVPAEFQEIVSRDPKSFMADAEQLIIDAGLADAYKESQSDVSFRITPEQDKAYMDAVEAGDMETAQRMVDEAAAAAGYTIRGDHGRVSKFTIFDRDKANPEGNWGQGFYFTNNEEDVENNYASVEGPDLEAKIEREVERRVNLAEMNEEFNEDGEVDEFAIREAVEEEFITAEPNVVHAAIKMDNPFVVGHGMVEIGEDGLGHYDMQETYLTAEYETDEDGEADYSIDPTGTLVDLVEALNDELSEYEGVNINAYDILSDNIDGMTASQFETEARELLENSFDYLLNDDLAIMNSEIIRAAIERAGFDGIVDNTVNQKFGTARRFGRTMEGMDENTRHYIAFQSNQIKETDPVTYDDAGNVIPLSERFNPENEDIRFRTSNDNQAIFVSNAARAVEGIKQEKATPEQWLKMIEKAGGLKAGEDKWMGLSDWLKASDKKTLTKAEVLDFINENMIVIEEQHYSNQLAYENNSRLMDEQYPGWRDAFSFEWDDYRDAPNAGILDEEEAATLYNKYNEDKVEVDEDGEIVSEQDRNKVILWGEDIAKVFFGQEGDAVRPIHDTREVYTTKGLINRHEIALTVPTIESWGKSDMIHFGDAGDGRAIAWIRFGETSYKTVSEDSAAYNESIDALYAYWDYLREKYGNGWADAMTEAEKAEEKRIQDKYKIKRANLRKKVLVIDEIQSKRHQEGREKGYKPDWRGRKKLRENLEKADREVERIEAEMIAKYGSIDKIVSSQDFDALEAAKEARREARLEFSNPHYGAIPDAPFDKNWHELAMKRMLRYAAENGYDVIAWTKGDQQNQRYALGGVVSSIEMAEEHDGFVDFLFNVKGEEESSLIGVEKESGIVHLAEEPLSMAEGKPLAGLVGKELAERMMQMKESEVLDADNLRIGGEGMKGFYDKMLPAFMNKYGKKWGVKVEDINLPNLEKGLTMHSVPVTEEMKTSVMEGQVMFRMRGENESARDFVQSVIDETKYAYPFVNPIRVDEVTPEVATRYGKTFERLQKTSAIFVRNNDLIVIFAHESVDDGDKVKRSIFHEATHKAIKLYELSTRVGKFFWDHSNGVEIFEDAKSHIMARYAEEKWHEEMMCTILSGAIITKTAFEIASVLPTDLRNDVELILNNIGYGRERKRSKIYWTNTATKDGRKSQSEGSVGLGAENGQRNIEKGLTAEERRIIREYFPTFGESDVRMRVNSHGKDLTEGQQEFFANSKAVDKDGNLLVLYHGTPRAGFTEFKSGFFTTSKEDAISYSGDRKGRLFDPNEKYEPETLTAGDFRLGYMTFDSEADRAAFLERFPYAEDVMSEREYEETRMGAEDEEYDALTARRKEFAEVWNAYREYERERFVDTTIGDLLANPEAYTEEDLMRAMMEYDSNASFDNLDDMSAEERRDALVSALQNANEEAEGGILDMVVPTRVPRNGEGQKHNDLGNRTYEVYANIERPYEIDANGRGSEFVSGDVYRAIEDGLASEEYDGVIVRNWRTGRHQQLGDVVIPKNGSQIKLTSNENPTESSDIQFRITESGEGDIRFSIRTKPAPKNVKKAVKLFNVDEKGNPHALFIDGSTSLDRKVWLDADSPLIKDLEKLEPGYTYLVDKDGNAEQKHYKNKQKSPSKAEVEEATANGSRYILVGQYANGKKSYHNWGINGSGQVSKFAMRPGWHLTDSPSARHIGEERNPDKKEEAMYRRPNQRWFWVEYAADVDYNEEAASNPTKDIQTHIPEDGYYSFKTNTNANDVNQNWIISGSIRILDPLSREEVRRENEKNGVPDDLDYKDEVSFRVTGTPTEDVVAEGVSLSPAQLASLAGDIFAALPEESRKKITDGLNGNILGLQDAILQISTSLATKENWNDEDRQMAEVVADQMTKAVGIEMTRPFSASEALWTLYNAVNKSTDLISEASRALVKRNLGFDSQTLEMEKGARDGVRFRTVGNASANASASMYNRGAANVWTRLKESFVDMNASVEKLVKAIEKRSGKKAEGFENILMALNQQSSKGLAAMEAYEQKFLNEMFDEIRWIMDKTDFKYEDIVRYVILKHGLERNEKMAQRDAKAHYQEIYDDIIAKIKGMNPAQKRTYLTNAQLRDADAKAELARLQGVNTSALTPDQLRDHKKELAKAKKEATEAAEHLVKAQKVATLTEQDAQDELDKIFKKIEKGTDSVYKEMRKNDYSGISSMFYDTLGVDRKNYATEEEYQSALMQAKADKYDNLGDIEGAAQMEVTLFENTIQTNNLWKSINKATKETLRQQYEANMISKDQYLNLRDMFEFYVPLRGFADNTAEDMYTYYRKPNSTGYTKPILGAEGRKTEAESPFGWIAAMAGSAIASNVKNEAKLALYYFVANRPDNGIATLSRTWFVHTPGDVDANGKKIFRPAYPPFNEDLSSASAKADYEIWQANMRNLQAQGLAYEAGQRLDLGNSVVNISDTNKPEHIVNVKVGGKDYTIVINGNPRAAQAINGDLNIESSAQDYSSVFGPMLRWMSSVNTSYNPEFWITNMMRDMAFTMMAVNIKEDPAYRRKFKKNYAKAFKVISMVAKNEKGTLGNSYIERMYKDFVKYGGVTGYTQIKDSETWEKEIENYLTSNDPASIRNGKAMRGVKSVFHAAHRFGESLEQVSRFAAFLTAVETGKSINEAINDAKEITVNFNRKGSGKMITLEEAKYLTDKNGQPLNKLEQWAAVGFSSIAPLGRRAIMFFNAAIQGLNATYQLWKKNKLRSIGWVSGYVAIGALNAVLHAMLDDDDDYLDIPQYERRNSLMIGGNGAYFKWALPQEARAFYALGDLAVESMMGRNPHQSVIGEALKISTEILPINPSEGWKAFMPSVAIPLVELALNEDYKGAPIYNEQKWLTEEEKKRSTKWSKAYSGTGDLYIGIAKVLNAVTGGDEHDAGLVNLQPEKIEHIVQSAFGGTIRTADKFINTIMAAFDPEEDVTIRQLPFLNRFLTINDERYKNVHVNDVYDYYAAEAEHAISLQKQYTKDRNSDALKDLRSSEEYKWARIYSKYKKPIKKYQEAIRAADTTNERMELMKQQDELKRKMIKEISDL